MTQQPPDQHLAGYIVVAVIAVVAVVAVFAIALCGRQADANGVPGDADCDSATTSRDALLVLQTEAALTALTPPCAADADLDGDGHLAAPDARLILGIVVHGGCYPARVLERMCSPIGWEGT